MTVAIKNVKGEQMCLWISLLDKIMCCPQSHVWISDHYDPIVGKNGIICVEKSRSKSDEKFKGRSLLKLFTDSIFHTC